MAHRLGLNGFFTDLAGHARTHRGGAPYWVPRSGRAVGTGTAGRPPGVRRDSTSGDERRQCR
nr:replication-relaxation family protein [Plantactinospora soyae]